MIDDQSRFEELERQAKLARGKRNASNARRTLNLVRKALLAKKKLQEAQEAYDIAVKEFAACTMRIPTDPEQISVAYKRLQRAEKTLNQCKSDKRLRSGMEGLFRQAEQQLSQVA